MCSWDVFDDFDATTPDLTGDTYGRYVPQSVLNKDGTPLDIDIVINEIFGDNDELYVEYSDGPQPYRVR